MNFLKKHIVLSLGLGLLFVSIFSCKKAPIDNKIFVERYLTGLWLVKHSVYIQKKGADTIQLDTVKLANDTVAFTKDLKYWRNGVLSDFQVDDKGELIKIKTVPDTTWLINALRKNDFDISFVRNDTINNEIYTYSTQRVLTKISSY